jgi:inner membrane protein
MASPVSHAIVAVTIGMAFPRPRPRARYWLAAFLSILPDADVIGFFNGVEYDSLLGHRGLTHSLVFAAVVAGMLIAIPGIVRPTWGPRGSTWLYLFLACASHGLLDAMTDGGLGIAFFSPFSNTRYFLPWRPIMVGPINILEAFSPWGREIALSELKWVIGPCLAVILTVFAIRKRTAAAGDECAD